MNSKNWVLRLVLNFLVLLYFLYTNFNLQVSWHTPLILPLFYCIQIWCSFVSFLDTFHYLFSLCKFIYKVTNVVYCLFLVKFTVLCVFTHSRAQPCKFIQYQSNIQNKLNNPKFFRYTLGEFSFSYLCLNSHISFRWLNNFQNILRLFPAR